MDHRGRLAFRSIRDEAVVGELGISQEVLARQMHVRTDDGRIIGGFPALVAISRLLPPLWPLWPFLVVAKWLGVGTVAYDWVARNRKIVPVGSCEDGACPIHRAQ
jgi:predicted DCC family thiol-disulfide oxidoreductase YuxK